MSRITIVREIRKAAELFKNFDITKSLNFYGNLATKYEAMVNEFFNSNSFILKNLRKEYSQMQ
ncbi:MULTISPECIES: hypothetical protein [spotted fever group]|uniref:Uncharacterized protein n=1 Tax=Rickettsia rhipicephali str. Ect TaxID=1359199 RepID=A0A0F3PHT8_RICRH|nr:MULTISPECIES: hypothetical protein [spotted fever group]KJV78774.1 hypothetical protein RMAECT_1510 [Rickettsia rhipicephali str. Ect]